VAKLKLVADPTFKSKVEVPLPEGKASITFVFKHRLKSDLLAFMQTAREREDLVNVMDVAVGWEDVDGEFNEANVKTLLENYHGAGYAIYSAYLSALTQVKKGN
jgi:hypothetical protein